MYTPDGWVLLKINGSIFKVFASWSGSYGYGDSWKINSGITKTRVGEDDVVFEGYSGSEYVCCKDYEGMLTTYNRTVLESLIKGAANQGDTLEIISLKEFLSTVESSGDGQKTVG